ncbi:MAG: hypothetical protein KJ072_11545 [Verrucomicrobia bacterium]|nr:hypothetical protein [Verrucomicrobiota bacterium]
MSLEVHLDWRGQTCLVGRLHAAERGASVSFDYASAFRHPLMDETLQLLGR